MPELPSRLIGYSYGSANIANTFTSVPISSSGDDVFADTIPERCWLDKLQVRVTSIAGGMSSYSWYLSHDSAGSWPITDVTAGGNITPGVQATDRGNVFNLERAAYRRQENGVAGTIYFQGQTDVGTCTISATLTWEK